MITVKRQWNQKGQLKSVAIATSGGKQAVIKWDKHGESTLLYGQEGRKQHRVVGVKEFEMGDGEGRTFRANVIEVRGQRIIKKTDSSLMLDGKEMPEDQMVFDLNKEYMSREEKQVEIRKMAILGKLLGLERKEVKQVIDYANNLKKVRGNG